MNGRLATALEEELPKCIQKAGRVGQGTIGFVSNGDFDTGFWVLSLVDASCKRGQGDEQVDLFIAADAEVFLLWLHDELDIDDALQRGLMTLKGRMDVLDQLSDMLG